jgi:hypothetical protein
MANEQTLVLSDKIKVCSRRWAEAMVMDCPTIDCIAIGCKTNLNLVTPPLNAAKEALTAATNVVTAKGCS